MDLIGAEDMLRLVAPAVFVPVFIGMIGDLELTGDIDALAAQMHASGLLGGALLVVVFCECH
jgi:hypothetical protein